MDILAVIPHDIASQGYMRSQVVKPLSYLSSLGLNVTLLCVLEESGERSERFAAELTSSGIDGCFVRPSRKVFLNYINCAVKAARIVKEKKPKALYAREVWGGISCLYAKRSSSQTDFVYDFRGAVPEEIVYCEPGMKGRIKGSIFEKLERTIIGRAARTNAVTSELSAHLFRKYGRPADTVIPCCAENALSFSDASVAETRKELGFTPEELVFIYSGGLSRWQMFEETVRLFSEVARTDGSARLLVLCPEAALAERMLNGSIPRNKFVVRSVPQKDVSRYMAASDCGFLLREDNVVNNVAFPIKFAEYAGAGVPVITTEGVREIACIARREGIGFIIDPVGTDISALIVWSRIVKTRRAEYSKKAQAYCSSELVWPRYRDDLMRLYFGRKSRQV